MPAWRCFLIFIKSFFMRSFYFWGLIALLSASHTQAQQARVTRHQATLQGTAALRNADDKYNASVINLEAPDVEHNADKKKLREIKEKMQQLYPRKAFGVQHKKTSAVMQPAVSIGFIADSLSGIPPDNYCAVSNGNKAVAVMNSNIAIHDANTGAYEYRKSLMAYSAAVGLNNSGVGGGVNYRFDPKVIYDPQADRFISVMLNSTNQHNWIVVGFSKTNDPSGDWNFYKFYGDLFADTTWFDYPAISITKNEFFLTGNQIKYNESWQAGFKQTLIYQIRKEEGYNGDSLLTYQIWDNIKFNDRSLRCLYPLKPGAALEEKEQYFLSNRNFDMSNDSIFLVKVPDTIGSADTVLTITPLISSLPYGVPPNALQPDTTKDLATNDGRVLGGFVKGDELQFVSTTTNAANGASAIYHGVIANFRTTPTVSAQIISIDTLDFGYPNISYTGNVGGLNTSIITYEFSGRRTFPGYGAVFCDGAGYSDMLKIKTGDNSIRLLSGREQRWGDYSGSQPDWDSPGAIWVEGIFGRKDFRYGNYMARLTAPHFTAVDDAPIVKSPASVVYPAPAWEYVNFEFTVSDAQNFSFVIYNMAGRVVDQVLSTQCKKGKNIIQFNVAPLAPGTYMLQAMGSKGEQIPVHKIVRR